MDSKTQVIAALENRKWDWRTVEGIARDTELSEQQILEILEASPNEIIRSRIPDAQGRALYTTRRHYAQRRGILDKFRST